MPKGVFDAPIGGTVRRPGTRHANGVPLQAIDLDAQSNPLRRRRLGPLILTLSRRRNRTSRRESVVALAEVPPLTGSARESLSWELSQPVPVIRDGCASRAMRVGE